MDGGGGGTRERLRADRFGLELAEGTNRLVPGLAEGSDRLIAELRLTSSGYVVTVDGAQLPVSRRHTRDLKDKLVRAAKQGWTR